MSSLVTTKVKPENLKRRDRTPSDPGVFMSYVGGNVYRRSLSFASERDKEVFEKNFESDGNNWWRRQKAPPAAT